MSGIRGLKLTAVVLVLCTAVVLANENRSDEAAFLAAVRQLDSAASLKRARKRLESLRQSSTDQLVRAEAAFQLGRAHRAARRSDLALQVWEEALSDAQGTVWRAHILVAIGHEHEAAGRTHEALIAYQQVLTENPRGTIALRAAVASGRLFEREDDLANALAAYEWSLNFAASTGLDRDTGIRNQLPAVRRRLTRLQHIVGQERAAAAQQQRTLAIQDRGEDVLLFEEARQAQLSGRTREALARYQQLDQRFPKSEHIAQAAFEAGRCLIALGEFGQAKAHWFTMIRLDPRGAFRGQAQIALGDLALEHDLDLSAARQRYERVISQAAGNVHESWIQASVDAQQRLGVCWMLLDQPEKCRQAFDRVRQAEIQAGFGGSVPLSDVLRTLVAIARDGKIELEDNDDPRADAVAYAELFRTGGTKSLSE